MYLSYNRVLRVVWSWVRLLGFDWFDRHFLCFGGMPFHKNYPWLANKQRLHWCIFGVWRLARKKLGVIYVACYLSLPHFSTFALFVRCGVLAWCWEILFFCKLFNEHGHSFSRFLFELSFVSMTIWSRFWKQIRPFLVLNAPILVRNNSFLRLFNYLV